MTHTFTKVANALGLFGLSIILLIAFGYQFIRGELPCPLCLLQRAAFAAVGVGLALNVCIGSRPSHYALTMLSAVAGGVIAARQVLLHIVPGSGAYGSSLFGMHFYTWALIAFVLTIVFTAGLLFFDRQFVPVREQDDRVSPYLGNAAVLLFLLVILANAISTLAECGVGLCPDNPTTYAFPRYL